MSSSNKDSFAAADGGEPSSRPELEAARSSAVGARGGVHGDGYEICIWRYAGSLSVDAHDMLYSGLRC